jgi:large subunit ribosomal protein L13
VARIRSVEGQTVKTYSPKAADVTRDWYVVDAEGLTLGRMATEVARVLRGKHKPTFAQHMDMGDFVIIVNADKVVLTSNKDVTKLVHHHSGYPGGLRTRSYGAALRRRPADTVKASVVGMLPKNRLGRAQARKLKVYAGPVHPHAAQQPAPLEIAGARRES